MGSPLVSAIVSTYNSEIYIEGKILDLLQQTIINEIEIIIINSGSTQGEEEIIKNYLIDHRNIKYIRTEERETIYKAWNRGIKIANGKFITNANTDDRLRKDAYEILANGLNNNPDVGLVYANQVISRMPNQDFKQIENNKIYFVPDYDPRVHLERSLILSQPMWRSSLHFEDNMWFDEKLEICGDHDFQLQVASKYKLLHIPITLGSFYLSKKSENKSFQNYDLVIYERRELTCNYIKKYIQSLCKDDLQRLYNEFERMVRLPIPLFLLQYKLTHFLFPRRHIHLLEFTYYFAAVIYEVRGENIKAINVCNKFLRKRYSARIERKRKDLISISA